MHASVQPLPFGRTLTFRLGCHFALFRNRPQTDSGRRPPGGMSEDIDIRCSSRTKAIAKFTFGGRSGSKSRLNAVVQHAPPRVVLRLCLPLTQTFNRELGVIGIYDLGMVLAQPDAIVRRPALVRSHERVVPRAMGRRGTDVGGYTDIYLAVTVACGPDCVTTTKGCGAEPAGTLRDLELSQTGEVISIPVRHRRRF